jgi:hypothetical protein
MERGTGTAQDTSTDDRANEARRKTIEEKALGYQ